MRGDTAIGHVDAHNELRDGILREAERFGVKVDIGGPYKPGDPAHIQEHNKTRAALDTLAKTAGIVVVLPTVHKLGDTGHAPGDHDKLAQALALIGKADAWNDATGGTITDYSKDGKRFRVHTFASSGTLVVKKSPRPFRALIVAGGSGGASNNHQNDQGFWETGGFDPYGGSGGAVSDTTPQIAAGSYPVTVGGGGGGGLGSNNSSSNPPPYTGARSAIEGIAQATGPNPQLAGTASDASGSSKYYSGQGQRSAVYNPAAGGSAQIGADPYQSGGPATPNTGGGGGCGMPGGSPHGEPGAAGAGGSGIVIISYQIGLTE